METVDVYNQKMACLALHLAGQSNKLFFKKFTIIEEIDFIKIGHTLYGEKFKSMMNDAIRSLHIHNEKNIGVISVVENKYPTLLKNSFSPPLALFYIGDLNVLLKPLISIVGTRKPSPLTIHWLKVICEFLSEQGFILVSGLALGIDSIVHANSFSRGTIGVSPQSLDLKFPKNNQYLYEYANQNKYPVLLFSEYPLSTSARKYHFVHRNRIIAGISDSIIFAEGGINSGAMITANWALKNQRRLFIIYSSLQKNNVGSLHLLNTYQAENITDSFPIDVYEKDYEKADRMFMQKNPYYLGNQIWVIFNKTNFSIKYLLPDQRDPGFV